MNINRKQALCLWIFCCVFACMPCWAGKWPIFSYGDNDELTVDHSLSIQERARLPRAVKILHLDAGADRDLLDNPAFFHNLVSIDLSNRINDQFLQALARNYPNIEALRITQITPLSEQAMSYLHAFQKLKLLVFHCQLTNPERLSEFIPRGVENLWISQPCDLPKLPKLRHLTVAHCSIDANFLAHLEVPKLEMLNLSEANIQDGALTSLSNFPQLTDLDLPKSFDKQRDNVSNLTHAHVRVQGDPIGPVPKLVAPLRPLPNGNY